MHDDSTPDPVLPWPGDLGRVCVADGWGVKIAVCHGRLVVCDGAGRRRRERRFARAAVGLDRVVILGASGMVSLEAVRWLAGVAVPLVLVDRDGRLLGVLAGPGRNAPALRRAQALASTAPVGVEVARLLLGRKLAGQAAVAATLPGDETTQAAVERARDALARRRSIAGLRAAEADAALAYWAGWHGLPVAFARSDAARVPGHWRAMGARQSPLASGPRAAATPANAILNYLYALLEAEARLACLAVGLDPGVGVVHTDQPARDSFALDLMEAARPQADAYALRLLRERVFRARDFTETRKGVCRLTAPLTHDLAAALPLLACAVAPVAEQVAHTLADGKGRRPTPLTQANRRAAKRRVKNGHAAPGGQPPVNGARDATKPLANEDSFRQTQLLLHPPRSAADEMLGSLPAGPFTVQDLARHADISVHAARRLVADALRTGLLSEAGAERARAAPGRPRKRYQRIEVRQVTIYETSDGA